MEFQIRNSYIKKFLEGFSHQNELKVIKYLTILGINQLEASNNLSISFPDLKKMAKNIAKTHSKEEKILNKELHSIKTELAKLNQKFEEKLKEGPETPSPNKKTVEQVGCRSASVPRNYDPRNLTKKPPSRWRTGPNLISVNANTDLQHNTRRASSIEPSTQSNWQESHHKGNKQTDDITPKPNEIVLPRVDPRENINHVTRHHLDDTAAKSILTEEGVIYFPKNEKSDDKSKNKSKGIGRSLSHNKLKEHEGSLHNGTFSLRKRSEDEDYLRPRTNDESPLVDHREFTKSPKFAQGQGKENVSSKTGTSPKNQRQERDSEISHKFPLPKPQRNGSVRKSSGNTYQDSQKSTQSAQSKKVKQKILRDKAMNIGRDHRTQMNQTHFDKAASEYYHVESKIRDEVKYHKELSRQYKKMRQSIQEYTNNGTEKYSNVTSSRDNNRGKFLFVEKDDERGIVHQYPFVDQSQRSGYPDTSSFIDSSPSQRSLYLKESSSPYSNKSPSYSISLARSRRSDIPAHTDNMSQSKSSAMRGNGGMLDIANSFLNSPFMQHLSNLDAKSSQISTSSINPSASASIRGNFHDVHEGQGRMKVTSSNFRRSPHREDDDIRAREVYQNNSKYSDMAPPEKSRQMRKENSSFLRESGNRRYAEYIGKESGSILNHNKPEATSFASSNFSNFLNDEMKGFFQKETLDLTRPKHSKSMARSSADSSHISFNAIDISTTFKDGNTSHMKRNNNNNNDPHAHAHARYNTNKSYVGDLADTSNVFKQERMSVTQLLNTTS